MKNPTVSIIIPVYNAEGTITRCLDSIIHQTYSSIKSIHIFCSLSVFSLKHFSHHGL